jgi:L-threonylcarbamoyladenylate synthase
MLPDIPTRVAVAVLAQGGLVAFPTETVYGLGADALDGAAVARIFALKGRPADHPLIVHLPAPDHPSPAAWRALLVPWADPVPDSAVALAAAFWPGPLTLVLRRAAAVPDAVTGGLPTVGLRVPAHPLAQALLRGFAALRYPAPAGVAAPSANRFGRISPTSAQHVRDEFGPALLDAAALDADAPLPPDSAGLLLDGGACPVGIESTIADLSGPVLRVLRPGAIGLEQLEACLAQPAIALPEPAAPFAAGLDAVRAPGMLVQHYAPVRELALLEAEEVADAVAGAFSPLYAPGSIALLGPDALLVALELPASIAALPLGDTPEQQAQRLYSALHEADSFAQQIWAVLPPPEGFGIALRDRLHRAAGQGGTDDAP